jgi:hypothetical protein
MITLKSGEKAYDMTKSCLEWKHDECQHGPDSPFDNSCDCKCHVKCNCFTHYSSRMLREGFMFHMDKDMADDILYLTEWYKIHGYDGNFRLIQTITRLEDAVRKHIQEIDKKVEEEFA